MSGTELKKILVSLGYNISEIANMLGFANSQRLHSALGAADVKSGLIEDLARVLNRNICDFFEGATPPPAQQAATTSDTSAEKYLSLLNKKDEQIDRLLRLIENLESKIK